MKSEYIINRQTPTSMTVTSGTTIGGTVADVIDFCDGNEVQIQEVTGVPGIDVEFTFTNVNTFNRIGISAYYVGSATHWVNVDIYDHVNLSWKTFWTFSSGLGYNYRFSDIPVTKVTRNNFISNNTVKLRFYHPTSGNAAHDLYINYVSISGR